MKIIEVTPSLRDISSGTTNYTVNLANALMRRGTAVEVVTLELAAGCQFNCPVHTFRRHRFPASKLGRSPEMLQYLRARCHDADVVIANGLWMLPHIYPAVARRGTNCKLVTAIHGTLTPYSRHRSRISKWLVGWLGGQYAALRESDLLLATSESEYQECRAANLHNPVAVIPLGVEFPETLTPKAAGRQLLYLSRIHPKKGVDILLEVWSQIQDDFPEWSLKIAGPINDYARSMQALARSLNTQRVEFTGEVTADKKWQLLGGSELFVLPSHSENFGIAVAESLAAGTAAIATQGTPWAGLAERRCGEWIEFGAAALERSLRTMLAQPREELVAMGGRGREWMRRDFAWDACADKLRQCCDWLTGNTAERPDFIIMD